MHDLRRDLAHRLEALLDTADLVEAGPDARLVIDLTVSLPLPPPLPPSDSLVATCVANAAGTAALSLAGITLAWAATPLLPDPPRPSLGAAVAPNAVGAPSASLMVAGRSVGLELTGHHVYEGAATLGTTEAARPSDVP